MTIHLCDNAYCPENMVTKMFYNVFCPNNISACVAVYIALAKFDTVRVGTYRYIQRYIFNTKAPVFCLGN